MSGVGSITGGISGTGTAGPPRAGAGEPDHMVDWLYVRIYCGDGDDTDALLPGIAHWLRDLGERLPIDSVHFLRFVDLRGHHVRLRLKAVPDVLDEAFGRLGELDSMARSAPTGVVERLVIDPPTSGGGSGRPGTQCAVYGPEYGKYGGPAGVGAAERHFDVASRWCLEHEVWDLPRPEARVALAARLLAGVADAGPVPAGELLAAHLRTWGPRLPARLRDGAVLGPVVEQVLARGPREVPAWGEAGGPIGPVAEDAARTVSLIGAGPGGRRAIDLVHIDVNRLGVNPAEEAVAGVCARYLLAGADRA